ncbi:MAG: DNA-binding domain-containing protein [Rhodospirillales bacterium]
MLALHDLQRRFAAAVVESDASLLAGSIVDDVPGAKARLAIYANHYRVTLIDALAAVFPVVQELVGVPFFRAAARRYVRMVPPASPCLLAYGGEFSAFLDALPEARSLPYLGDVARLEWALNEASHAPGAPALADDASPSTADGRSAPGLHLHPSCRLISSPFPVERIWRLHRKPCGERETVDLNAGGARLLVHRRQDDVGWLRLSPADYAFLQRLIIGGRLDEALALARTVDHRFDPTDLLTALIEGGLVSSIGPVS